MSLDQYKDLQPQLPQDFSLPQHHRFRGKAIYVTEEGRQFYESWIPPQISEASDDRYLEVTPGTVGRLDLISFDIYGTPKFWWLIAVTNNIFDPFEDMYPGMILRCPSQTRIYSDGIVKLV